MKYLIYLLGAMWLPIMPLMASPDVDDEAQDEVGVVLDEGATDQFMGKRLEKAVTMLVEAGLPLEIAKQVVAKKVAAKMGKKGEELKAALMELKVPEAKIDEVMENLKAKFKEKMDNFMATKEVPPPGPKAMPDDDKDDEPKPAKAPPAADEAVAEEQGVD